MKMIKYKVGQKVRVKGNIEVGSYSSHNIYFADEMADYKGRIVTIKRANVFEEEYQYKIDADSSEWLWDEEWFESVNEVKNIEDLKDGDIITLGNGDRLSYFDGSFTDLNDVYTNNVCDLSDLNYDLTFKHKHNKEENKVVKVERPLTYYEVFNREETVKEMTIEEISKALGYKVKIVKNKDTN